MSNIGLSRSLGIHVIRSITDDYKLDNSLATSKTVIFTSQVIQPRSFTFLKTVNLFSKIHVLLDLKEEKIPFIHRDINIRLNVLVSEGKKFNAIRFLNLRTFINFSVIPFSSVNFFINKNLSQKLNFQNILETSFTFFRDLQYTQADYYNISKPMYLNSFLNSNSFRSRNYSSTLELSRYFYWTTDPVEIEEKLTYDQLISIDENQILRSKGFLTDYHTIKILERLSGVDKYDIVKTLTHFANLLRLAKQNNTFEINCITFRIRLINDRFIITNF